MAKSKAPSKLLPNKAPAKSKAPEGVDPLEESDLGVTVAPGNLPFRGQVDVFGAGIAGLTAAHELAERGFFVRIFEKARIGKTHRPDIGGMAKTQYATSYRFVPDKDPNNPAPVVDPHAPTPRKQLLRLQFEPGSSTIHPLADQDIQDFLTLIGPGRIAAGFKIYFKQGDALGLARGRAVAKALKACAKTIYLGPIAKPKPKAGAGAPGPNQVILVAPTWFFPGEHGFRFFPSYYSHVFDTMGRIPIYDVTGSPTQSTVYDNLVPTPYECISEEGRSPFLLAQEKPSDPFSMMQQLGDTSSFGYLPTDIPQFVSQIVRFMMTSRKRRAAEFENISWWQFLTGYNQSTGATPITYSQQFERDIKFSGKVLAAFDADYGDARTDGDTWIQLFMNFLQTQSASKVNGTLAGPTTESWMVHWRTRLQELGVEFHWDELQSFEVKNTVITAVNMKRAGTLQPKYGTIANPKLPYFFICAVDPFSAEGIAENTLVDGLTVVNGGQLPGVLEGLVGYTTTFRTVDPLVDPTSVAFMARANVTPDFIPIEQIGVNAWDRFQTLAGIQYYFTTSFSLNAGYVYYLNDAGFSDDAAKQHPKMFSASAPTNWALSSINSQQVWTRQPTLVRDGYSSVMSVDIGAWQSSENTAFDPNYPIEKSAHEISLDVYTAITASFNTQPRQGVHHFPGFFFYHIDNGIVFDTQSPFHPKLNQTPFLIPTLADWLNRPGSDPWDPTPGTDAHERVLPPFPPVPAGPTPNPNPPVQVQGPPPGVLFQASHGVPPVPSGYQVHWKQLVFAGNYLKTFTRMTTMESANESGRHAVNAILDVYETIASIVPPPIPPIPFLPFPPIPIPGIGPGPLPPGTFSPFTRAPTQGTFPSTVAGDYCRIWNIEENELPALVPFRRLDAILVDMDMRSVFEELGFTEFLGAFRGDPYGMDVLLKNMLDPTALATRLANLLRRIKATAGNDELVRDIKRLFGMGLDDQPDEVILKAVLGPLGPWVNVPQVLQVLRSIRESWEKNIGMKK